MSDTPITTIEFDAEEVLLLSSILRWFNQPLTTTQRRLIRPMFSLINKASIPHKEKMTEVSHKHTSMQEVELDGKKVRQPTLDQAGLDKEFGAYMKEQKDILKISFIPDEDTSPMTVAITFFATQIWVGVQVPEINIIGTTFDKIDEKFCKALPVLGRLIKKDSTTPVPDEK